ncbi:MAG: sugar phosphate isomerase/epimerase [Saprospiraceae bacterium]|nr:sugar phosphate isomerase/epimerase [Saprospiraceae bacterium]
MRIWNRRDFLQTSAVASAFATSSLTHLFDKSRPLSKKSLKYGMIKGGDTVLEKFQMAKAAGFHGVELNYPHELKDEEILEAKKITGLEIPGVVNSKHWKSPLSDPDPAVRKICTDSMIDALYACKKYGGTTVLLVPAVVNAEISYAEAWDRSVVEIEKMLPIAQETGIKIALENVWNNFLLSPLEAVRYIDQFNSNMLGWYMDIGNVIRYGWAEHWIEALGSRIMKIDVKEYSRKLQKEEGVWEGFKVKIGDGDCNWAAVNAALAKVGYGGEWGSAEVPGGDQDRLNDISERMDKVYAL